MPRKHVDIILFGGALPLPVYVLRIPAGVAWRTAMQACQRLVKRLTNTPSWGPAPHWSVAGDAPDWETTKQLRYQYNPDTRNFEEV